MNIPEEAVEAAAKAHLAHKAVRSPGNAKNAMREALEAAAPFIQGAIMTPDQAERLRDLFYEARQTTRDADRLKTNEAYEADDAIVTAFNAELAKIAGLIHGAGFAPANLTATHCRSAEATRDFEAGR